MSHGRQSSAKPAGLSQLNLNAAGIDVGATSHFAAVPADRAEQPVQEFEAFTADLYRLADWLAECGVETVVMESTGVYRIPLFGVLEERGFQVMLVDPRRIKNVPGRKTDVLDCQWLQQLHTYGLLSGAFRPDGEIRRLRSYRGMMPDIHNKPADTETPPDKSTAELCDSGQLSSIIGDVTSHDLSIIPCTIHRQPPFPGTHLRKPAPPPPLLNRVPGRTAPSQPVGPTDRTPP